jgi:hypothetical protein
LKPIYCPGVSCFSFSNLPGHGLFMRQNTD